MSNNQEVWTLERFMLSLILQATKRVINRFPLHWFGTYNALNLYLNHPSYSPFLPRPDHWTKAGKEKYMMELVNRPPPWKKDGVIKIRLKA